MAMKQAGFFCAAKIQSLLSCLYYKRKAARVCKNYSDSTRFGKKQVRKREDFKAGNQIFCPLARQNEVCIFKIIILAPHKNLL